MWLSVGTRDNTGQPAPSGAKTIDPRSLGLTPEQVKSFGLKTGAEMEPKEEELPDDPQTPVPPEEDEPAPAVGQVVAQPKGEPVVGVQTERTIGIPVAHLLSQTKKPKAKPVVPQFNQVKTIDRSARQPLLRPNGKI